MAQSEVLANFSRDCAKVVNYAHPSNGRPIEICKTRVGAIVIDSNLTIENRCHIASELILLP